MVPNTLNEIRKAFLKIKEDITFLYSQILRDRQLILDFSTNLSNISSKLENLEKKLDSLLQNGGSIGNKGVNRRLSTDRPSTVHQSIDSQSMVEPLENSQKKHLEGQKRPNLEPIEPLNLPVIRPERESTAHPSTDVQPLEKTSKKQLMMYISIFRLQKELKRPITYVDLAQKTNLTESGVKYLIRTLNLLKCPLILHRNPDNLTCVSVPRELRNDEFERFILHLLDTVHERQKKS